MKRWHLLRYVFPVVVVALLLASGVVAQSSCEVADSLRAAKMYEKAQIAYVSVLENTSLDANQRACALIGIKELQRKQAEELYKLGKIYEEQKQLDKACDAYIESLKINPNSSDAQSALGRINDSFAEMRTLANKGLYTEAVDKFKKVVENNPNISVPEDLNYLFGGKYTIIWRWLKLQTDLWIRPIGELFVLIAIVMLAGFAIYYRIYPWIRGFHNLKFYIKDFDKGITGLDIGKGMKALVEESYKQLGEGHARLHLVDKPSDKLEIPANIKGAPYFKIVSQLIEWVFPQNVITLSGYLQKSGNLGNGLTLALVNSRTGEIVANHTIWQKDFDTTITQQEASVSNDQTPYVLLAKLAAIWTHFQLCKEVEKYDFSSIGTQKWLSFAYLRAGAFWNLKGNKVKARQLYVEALNQDINHKSVLFNLGVLDIEDKDYDHAIERLSIVKKLSERDTSKLPKDNIWYLATYQLAAVYHYKSILFKTKKDLYQAEKESCDLVEKIYANLSEPQSSMEARENKLKQFLQWFKLKADIMHASIIADQGKTVEAEEKVNNIKHEYKYSIPYRVQYNFACYYSIVGNKTKSTNAYNQALYHLEYALERGGDIINWAQNDLSLEGIRKDEKEAFDQLIKKVNNRHVGD